LIAQIQLPIDRGTLPNLGDRREKKSLLRGNETQQLVRVSSDPLVAKTKSPATGWLVKRRKTSRGKKGQAWEVVEVWLQWEEPDGKKQSGKKRSCFVPKAKQAAVYIMVYEDKSPIQETLRFLGKKYGQ
jgi:hypothetical protein